MAAPKKKPKIQATDVVVGNRTLEAVMADLAEQVKANDARSARAEEQAAAALQRSARAEEQATAALERIDIAQQTIAAMLQDLRALTQEFRAFAGRTDSRLNAIEQGANA